MKVWITKYALSKGVIVADANKISGQSAWLGHGRSEIYAYGNDWHTNEVAARDRVLDMIDRRRALLEKQRAKLERLRAKVVAGQLPMAKGREHA